MAIVTGLAVILVTRYTCVIPSRFSLVVTAQAVEDLVIIWIWVTIGALVPFPCVAAAVYWEVLVVMIESGWDPGILSMAQFAVCRKLSCQVVWVGGLVVVIRMASITGVRSSGIVSEVTQVAFIGYSDMSSLEYPIIVVNRESSRFPARIGGMTGFASRG